MSVQTLSNTEREFVAVTYDSGMGTIHGFAAYYGVSIGHIKQTLDDYGVPHGKHTMAGRKNFSMKELVRQERIWKERMLERKLLARKARREREYGARRAQ